MKKIVKIGSKEYTMQSSAFTQFKYRNDTGRKLMQDINRITELRQKDSGTILEDLDEFLEIILNITYVMIEEADPNQTKSFEDFLRNTDALFDTQAEWVQEVIELAMSPISRGTQGNPQ
jgi:hypothetical protein